MLAKELLREVYSADGAKAAAIALAAFYRCCADAGVAELTRLAKTIAAWEDEVLAYHLTGLSNGPTEAMNLIGEEGQKGRARLPELRHYRLRLLLHCGVMWQDQRSARLRATLICVEPGLTIRDVSGGGPPPQGPRQPGQPPATVP